MSTAPEVIRELKPIFKHHKWKVKGSRWSKQCDDVILMCHIQKSSVSDSIMINWGVIIRAYQEYQPEFPHAMECTFQGRFDEKIGHENLNFQITKESKRGWEHNEHFPKEKKQIHKQIHHIKKFMKHEGIHFLEKMSTINGIKDQKHKISLYPKVKKFLHEHTHLKVI